MILVWIFLWMLGLAIVGLSMLSLSIVCLAAYARSRGIKS